MDTSTRRSFAVRADDSRRRDQMSMLDRLPDPSRRLAPGSPCGAAWSRLEARLTTLFQLRFDAQPASSAYSVEPPGDALCITTSSQRFRPRRSLRIEPLTLPVAASQRVTNHPLRRPPELPGRALSSSEPTLEQLEAPSTDGCSPTIFRSWGTRHRNCSFAPAIRLPTLFRLSGCRAWRD